MPKENRVAFNKRSEMVFITIQMTAVSNTVLLLRLYVFIYQFGVINIYQWDDLHSRDRFNKKPLRRSISFYDTISTDLVIYASRRWKPHDFVIGYLLMKRCNYIARRRTKQPRSLKINGVCSIETRNKIYYFIESHDFIYTPRMV